MAGMMNRHGGRTYLPMFAQQFQQAHGLAELVPETKPDLAELPRLLEQVVLMLPVAQRSLIFVSVPGIVNQVGLRDAHERIMTGLQISTLSDLLWLKPDDLQQAQLRLPEMRRFEHLQSLVKTYLSRTSALTTVWTHALEDLRRTEPRAFDILSILAWLDLQRNRRRKKTNEKKFF